MRKKLAVIGVLGLLIFGASFFPADAGDSIYGKVTEVKRSDLVAFDYGSGQYEVRIVGVDPPGDAELEKQARDFISSLVLNKNARFRFERRNQNREMVGRLYTDERGAKNRDVGLELVRSGLAQKQARYDYKYREMSAAEAEARTARRGLWSPDRK